MSNELLQLARDLEAQPATAAQGNPDECPVHHVPWINTKYGPAHKIDGQYWKWCYKDKLNSKQGGYRR